MGPNNSTVVSLLSGRALLIDATTAAGTTGSVTRLPDNPGGGEPFAPVAINGANITIGPFGNDERYLISCTTGDIQFTVARSVSVGLPLSGGTLTALSAGADLLALSDPAISGAAITSSFAGGSFSQAEYVFKNNISGQNVLSVQNNNPVGYSAYTVRAIDRAGNLKERAAFGYALYNTGYIAANQSYVEFSGYPQSTPASFTGVIAAGVLTASSVTGSIRVGDIVCGANLSTQVPTIVTSLGTGTGGAGTYNVSGTVTASSSAMTSGTAAAFRILHTGFLNGTNKTLTRAQFTEDGHIWFYNGAGNVTVCIDPTNGYLAINGTQDAVVPLDVKGNALFGNGGNANRASGATFPVTIDDTSGNVLRGVKDLVVKFDLIISGSGATRQVAFVDSDNGSVAPLTMALNGTGQVKTAGPFQAGATYTVATLPAASAGLAGFRAYVTDATAPTFLGALTGGGAVGCPVFCNGTAWLAG